ncbi:cytochrome P450 [Halomarina pelagica]|uniref:cytochrome P450 n=1 Tax=Halomarina pelagica TaxID=2961599 RepID=UPI0020C25E75|nr:cytochrome P450 [Halomarina sp. BND7]
MSETLGPRPPGPDGLPILGNTVAYARDPFGFTTRAAEEHGDVVYIETAGRPFYQLTHPDDIEYVLVHNNGNYVKGALFQRLLGPVTGRGLLNSEGETWRRQRHLVQPAFHPDRIARYAGTMTDYAERMLDSWGDGERRDVHEDMMGLTLEIVADALFGVDIRDEAPSVGRALDVVMEHSEDVYDLYVPDRVPTPSRWRYRRAVETLDEVVYDIIDERRSAGGDDVISMLAAAIDERGRGMSDEQLRDEVMTLLLAGHETTALALSFTWYLLAQYPSVEGRLVDELDRVLADGGGIGRARVPTLADLDDLGYAERVIRESMRLYPPVHGIVREPVEDDEIGGYRVPAGVTVSMPQWAVHRDPRWYDDPMAFRPERWTPDFEASLPSYAYFPFGGGPRRCVGDRFALLEARLVLATVARRYHLELPPSTDLDLLASITTRPKDGVEMVVHER